MSYIDLLFPAKEPEALKPKATMALEENLSVGKKRKLDAENDLLAPRKHQKIAPATQRRNTIDSIPSRTTTVSPSGTKQNLSSCSSSSSPVTHPIKRTQSNAAPPTARLQAAPTVKPSSVEATTSTPLVQPAPTRKSCLPSFIDASILKSFLQHLHPNDRSRYVSPDEEEVYPPLQKSSTSISSNSSSMSNNHESASSPASMTTDDSSSPESDSCPTPTPGIYEQLRSGPFFADEFHGFRCTAVERDLMQGLLGPANHSDTPAESPRPQSATGRGFALVTCKTSYNGIYRMDGTLLRRMFPKDHDPLSPQLEEKAKDLDITSSKSKPSTDQENGKEEVKERPVLSNRGFVISVDDFFDLEEASD